MKSWSCTEACWWREPAGRRGATIAAEHPYTRLLIASTPSGPDWKPEEVSHAAPGVRSVAREWPLDLDTTCSSPLCCSGYFRLSIPMSDFI